MAEVSLDVVEDILVRLDVKDLIRCKSVCKSWQSLISTSRFVKAHLNHAYKSDHDNNELGHRRICLFTIMHEEGWLYSDTIFIVGSCNGLVCVSPKGVEFLLINPSTRELNKLPTPPYRPQMRKIAMIRQVVCWGFGYDAGADDYKVIAGFTKNLRTKWTTFLVLTLKSNTWKVIRRVKYKCIRAKSGILCDGTIHWLMTDEKENIVIISLDLSTEEFKEIPLPYAYAYNRNHRLGVFEDGLCIYSICSPLSSKKWVMKNNKWKPYVHDHCQTKYDIAHFLPLTSDTYKMSSLEDIDGIRVRGSWEYTRASIFVKSLVSPHLHNNNEGQRRNTRKKKMKGEDRIFRKLPEWFKDIEIIDRA